MMEGDHHASLNKCSNLEDNSTFNYQLCTGQNTGTFPITQLNVNNKYGLRSMDTSNLLYPTPTIEFYINIYIEIFQLNVTCFRKWTCILIPILLYKVGIDPS